MLKITQRDRIFAAIAVPAALLAAYLFLLRAPLAREVASMRDRLAALGDADTLRTERAILDRRLAESRAALHSAEQTAASPPSPADAPQPSAPARLQRVMTLLRDNPAPTAPRRITATELLAEGPSSSPSAPLLREALGGQPPALWRFTATADYPSVVAALRALAAHPLPVVVEGIALDAPAPSTPPAARTWRIDVCL